ncbi:MAG: hypothetical protein ACXVBO_13000, partial [Isosphaeraceae bacterium]
MTGPERPTILRSLGTAALARVGTLPISLFASLLTTRVIVSSVGVDAFGAVALLVSLPLLFPWADLGVGSALTTAIAHSNDPREDPNVSAVTRRCLKTTCLSALIVSVAAIILSLTGTLSLLLGMRSFPDANRSGALVICIFAVGIPLSLGFRRLVGLGRNHLSIILTGAAPIAGLILVWAVATAGASPLAFAVATPLANTGAAGLA